MSLEEKYSRNGYRYIAGIDEAGRGPLAGPVVASAVIFDVGYYNPYIKDSKKLSPRKREKLFNEIKKDAISIGIGIVDEEDIDKINILNATIKAMKKALLELSIKPDLLLIDGNIPLPTDIPQFNIIDGDDKILSISAASIIAKVTRDRIMDEYHKIFPQYNFSSHKGYGTKEHIIALKKYGPCKIHRKSFKGVK
jgi:ribonuclease HII